MRLTHYQFARAVPGALAQRWHYGYFDVHGQFVVTRVAFSAFDVDVIAEPARLTLRLPPSPRELMAREVQAGRRHILAQQSIGAKPALRRCSRCRGEKPLAAFGELSNGARQPYCRECQRAYARERRSKEDGNA